MTTSFVMPEPLYTDPFVLETSFNADALRDMLRDESIPFDVRKQLTKFNKTKINHNTANDIYKYKSKKIGRLYSPLQQFPKEFRTALLGDNCVEIDFENCHPVLIAQCGDMYGTPTDGIKFYLNNRELCLEQTHEDRDTAKQYFLKAQYGGNVTGICKPLDDFYKEVAVIATSMKNDSSLKPIYDYAKKQFELKGLQHFKSLLASFQAYVLQTIENRNMLALYKYLSEHDACVKLLNHDGIIIDGESFDYKSHKEEMETFIFQTTNFRSPIAFKPCEYTYKPTKQAFVVVKSEQDVVLHLHKYHNNAIRRGVDGFYIANRNELFYSKGEEGLRVLIKNNDYRRMNKDGDILPYSATTKGMEDIVKYINKNSNDFFSVDESFIEKVNTYTRGRAYFKNGYIDTTGAFHKTPQEQLPIVYINRDAPDLSIYTTKTKQEYLCQFWNMYTKEQATVVLKMFSRAMFGYRDKNWSIFCGLRNSGKGVQEKAVKHSIGDYCANMELPMTKTQHSGDASQYRVVLTSNLHIKRIAFTNESTSIEGKRLKLDGNAMKKFVSGGDPVKCRALYKDEVDVVFNARLFVNVNSIPDADPADTMMTCLPIKMPYKFVAEPLDICERPTDTDIKYKIDAVDPNILISILVDNFVNRELTINDLTENDIDEYNCCTMQNATEAPYIFKTKLQYEKGAWINSDQLRYLFKPSGMTPVALGKFLSARMKPCKKQVDGQRTNGYSDYRLKLDEYNPYSDEGEDEADSISSVDM